MHVPRSPFEPDTPESEAVAEGPRSELRGEPAASDEGRPGGARPIARDDDWGPRVRETLRDARIALAALKESLS